jgi:hydrogenase maturation protease
VTRSPAGPAPSVLVIGYGNSLRGDDAAGPVLADRLAALALPGVEVRVSHQLTPELAADLAGRDAVVFLDAALGENVRVEIVEPDFASTGLGHAGNPARLLGLAQRLFGSQPRAWLVTIPAAVMELGAALSPRTRTGIEEAEAAVRRLLEAWPARGE